MKNYKALSSIEQQATKLTNIPETTNFGDDVGNEEHQRMIDQLEAQLTDNTKTNIIQKEQAAFVNPAVKTTKEDLQELKVFT